MNSFRELAQVMTTTDLAEACGVSRGMASLIRSGERAITLRRLAAFIAHTGADGIDVVKTITEEAAITDRLSAERRANHGG
tara:strand:+ start:384 stop:626 length:243 start_codon:yes stop_codon:yes gene_type:complete